MAQRAPPSLPPEPDPGIDPHQQQVRNERADDGHDAQQQDDGAGQEHVLGDQRLEQQRADRRQAQHERHDDAARHHVGKQIADGAHERIEGHPDRIAHDDPVFRKSARAGRHHIGLPQFVEQVGAHDADQLRGSGDAKDDGRDRQVLGEVPHLLPCSRAPR